MSVTHNRFSYSDKAGELRFCACYSDGHLENGKLSVQYACTVFKMYIFQFKSLVDNGHANPLGK